ncbi:MAG: hypothetical protein ACREA3_08065 [Nitrosotalea sp.]
MKRGYGILIAGVCMLIFGHFLSQWIIGSIPTINPSHSTMLSDAQYHMLSWSNQLSTISEVGIMVLIIGGFVLFIDHRKSKQNTG